MIKISNLSYAIEGKPLFVDASVTIPSGHKVGLVGRNGAGKTTLFNLLRGDIAPDGGEVEIPRQARIGGVAQEAPSSEVSLLDTVLAADTERARLMKITESETDAQKLADAYARLTQIDAFSAEARAASILNGLGFDNEAQALPCSAYSGGWRMRVALAAVLFSRPDFLLLDEPTNYLDLEGTIWLENFLARYPFTVLVISHDRDLLNKSVGAILHLNEKQLTLYQGGYDTFDEVRRMQMAQSAAAAKKQAAAREHIQSYVDRFRAKASKAKQAQSRLKMLERMEPIEAMVSRGVAGFHFDSPDPLSPPIISISGGSVGYNGVPVLSNLDLRIDPDDRIALLGANGQGKSTLSKLLAGKLKQMSGDIVTSNKLRVGYFSQHQMDELNADETPLMHIQRVFPKTPPSQLRSKLARGGIGPDQVDTVAAKLSGGQRSRLAMLMATLHQPHLLILDEPTNHLDIESREALISALMDFNGAVILVSHDAHLVSAVADQLWLVNGGKVVPYDGDMETYRAFLLSETGKGGAVSQSKAEQKAAKPSPKAENRKRLAPLQAEAAKCEERIEKLEEMRVTIDSRLANPLLYAKRDPADIEKLNKKRAEVAEALIRAEELWMKALDRLEKARAG